jgi:dihydroorotate dehydrogenase (fumarate)
MVELGCDWLGLRLANPFVVGASPLCDSADDAVALVDVGASAVVVHSLFEEQLIADQVSANRYLDSMIDTQRRSPVVSPPRPMSSPAAPTPCCATSGA